MKNRVAILLACVMLFSTICIGTAGAENFSDVSKGAWYYDDVMSVTEAGIMAGVGSGKFDPNGTLTRSMIAQSLWALDGKKGGYTSDFSDVKPKAWYYQGVSWAQATGIVAGIGNNQFGPDQSLTREQLAAMLYRYAEQNEYDMSGAADLSKYTDGTKVSNFAKQSVTWAVSEDIFHITDNKIRAKENAIRADVAKGIAYFLKSNERPTEGAGKSAYEIACDNGYVGTVQEWLASLVGAPGKDGMSAYELAVKNGYSGTEAEWLKSLAGKNGKSAYEIACDRGFSGTEEEWLASLHGENGKSAYELACEHGYKGTEEEWLASLAGTKGDPGNKGEPGVGVVNAYIDDRTHLILVLSDDSEIDAGYVGVSSGDDDPTDPPEKKTYTVTFCDYDGTVLKTQTVEEGANASPPADPQRAGYVFTGWDKGYTNVTSGLTVTAQYVEETGAPILQVEKVTAAAGDTQVAVKVSIQNNPGLLTMALNIFYDADAMTLTKVTNGEAFSEYSITVPKNKKSGCITSWYITDLPEVTDGDVMTLFFDIAPTAAAGNYEISVSGAEGGTADGNKQPVEPIAAAGSVTVKAGESPVDPPEKKTYTVTFCDYDGTVLKTQTVEEGANAAAPADPQRAGYVFIGWDTGYTNVTSDLTVTAQYAEETGAPILQVEKVTAAAGDTQIAVKVSIRNNPGLLTMALNIFYDADAMTLTKVTNGEAFSEYSITVPKNKKSGCITSWYITDLPDVTDGDVMTLFFDIAQTAAAGNYEISVSGAEGGTIDGNKQPVDLTAAVGSVTVK